jgi:hypothetical protein
MTVGGEKLDDYFDQLDAAFTNLSGKPGDAKPAAAAPAAEIDWFGLKPAAAATERPESSAPAAPQPPAAKPAASAPAVVPRSAAEPVPAAAPVSAVGTVSAAGPVKVATSPAAVVAAVVEVGSVAEVAAAPAARSSSQVSWDPPQRSLPGLADAFAAILAAEQGESSPAVSPAWPSTGGGSGLPDDLVEQVSRRVLEQLSDRVGRDAVVATVSAVAERLVREEIERIKAAIV